MAPNLKYRGYDDVVLISPGMPTAVTIDTSNVGVDSSESKMASSSNASEDDPLSPLLTNEKCHGVVPWIGILVWPLMIFLPLLLSNCVGPTSYKDVFPSSWYEYDYNSGDRPKPLGVILGILCVGIGQIFVLCYFYLHKYYLYQDFEKDTSSPPSIQVKGAPSYVFSEGLQTHLSQPEGFVLLALYLSGTWMFRLMPPSYYSFEGKIDFISVFFCLAVQDFIQFIMHRLEHVVSPTFYKYSHKPHHKFTNPRLFDAFNGSIPDTILMILIPLYITAQITRTCNVWTYMAFGSFYANWLTLIHSEYPLPWDKLFRMAGFGTPGDHHVHHKFFKFNFGHLFMWYDRIGGTYRNPMDFAPRVFSPHV